MIATTTKFILLGAFMMIASTQANEGGLRLRSSDSSQYRRHLLTDQECVLYKAEVRYGTGEEGDPFTDEVFWSCEFEPAATASNSNSRSRARTNIFDEPQEQMIPIVGLSNEDIEEKYGAVSGESVMNVKDMVIEEHIGTADVKLRVTHPEDVAIEALSDTDVRHSRNRKLMAERKLAAGTYKTLVVRIKDSANKVVNINANDLSEDIFTAPVSMGTHYAECSADKTKMVPSSDGGGTGVVTVNINTQSTTDSVVRTAAWNEINRLYKGGKSSLWSKYGGNYDLIMMCIPPGTGDWVAYAYINHYVSVYNDHWCGKVSANMHEVGHNLNLAHSGHDGNAYGDQSGLMGYSYNWNGGPKMCFNPAKSYQLGWYDDQVLTIDPAAKSLGSYDYVLNGAANYQKNKNALISLRLQTDGNADYYVGYNHAVGANSESQEGRDRVLVVRKTGGGVSGYGESELTSVLASNQSWKVTNWMNSGRDVTVTVTSSVGSSIRDAKITVKICPPAGCPANPAPTKAPTPPPVKPPTKAPTKAPTPQDNDEPIPIGKPKCTDATGKILITNKKGTKTQNVKCQGVSKKKCNWKTQNGQKLYKTCPVKCQSKIKPKNLAKLWCEF